MATSLFAGGLIVSGQVAAQTPASPSNSLAQVQALLDQGKLADAEAGGRGYVAAHENAGEAHFLLGFILFRENKPAASLGEYTAGARLQTPTASQLKVVALDYVLANDYADADKWMTRSAEWAPKDSDTWYSLGRIKYTLNRFAEAIDCFQKALALSPQMVKAENNIGLAFEGLNETDQAIAAYRTAISWQAASPHPSEQPLLNLGTLLLDSNQAAAALPLLSEAAALAPDDAKTHAALGRLYQRQGRFAEAQAELERTVTLSPDTAAYHFQLGQVYRKAGESEKAKTEFARAAALDGAHSSD